MPRVSTAQARCLLRARMRVRLQAYRMQLYLIPSFMNLDDILLISILMVYDRNQPQDLLPIARLPVYL